MAQHTYSKAETRGYCDYINGELSDDPDLASDLPMDPNSNDLFKVISKGLLIIKLINKTFEGTVDLKKIKLNSRNQFDINLNLEASIEGAKDIGCSIVGIGALNLANYEGVEYLVLGLLWQVIKRCLLSQLDLTADIGRLMDAAESLADVPPEQILLRWFNYHLNNAGHSHRKVTNFSQDIQDAECYAVLLAQIAPEIITSDDLERAFRERDFLKRAELVLGLADKLGCRKFVTAQDIVDGNPKLNLAFVATLFKNYPSLGATAEELARKKASELEEKMDDLESLLAEAVLEKDSIQSTLDETLLELDSLSDEVKSLGSQLKDALNEKDALMEEKCSLEELLGTLQEEKDDLASKLSETEREKDDLFAQLEREISCKLDVENELNDLKAEFERTKDENSKTISDLQSQLENETQQKTNLNSKLEETLQELELTKASAANKEQELTMQLEAERETNEHLSAELADTKKALAESQQQCAEMEQTKDELFKLLNDTITELETTKNNARATEEDLRAQLEQERAAKEDLQRQLFETKEEYEKAKADWEEERKKLLARIAQLEEELETLKNDMRIKLEEAEREKEEALAMALAEKERALNDAANEKDQALDKVRLLLTGNQKQGYLWKQENSVMGLTWKKKFFVLRDNLLCWYSSERISNTTKPKGVIYCEEARLYELDEKEIKRDFAFQIDTGKVRTNIAADSLEELKEWMTEIRVAKKKKLGVKVVSEETAKKKRDN